MLFNIMAIDIHEEDKINFACRNDEFPDPAGYFFFLSRSSERRIVIEHSTSEIPLARTNKEMRST